MFQAKQFYLDELKDGPKAHRGIANKMTSRFEVSTAKIRDELVEEGLIAVVSHKIIGSTNKRDYAYKLTGKSLKQETPDVAYWSDGLVKSTGNAFDWRNGESNMFSKQEIANQRNAGKPHNYNPHPVSAYARA